MDRPYYMAPDCPNCGQKDELNKWQGARQGNTAWKHDYMCCSEKCGLEFFHSAKHKALERQRIKDKIYTLNQQLEVISKWA